MATYIHTRVPKKEREREREKKKEKKSRIFLAPNIHKNSRKERKKPYISGAKYTQEFQRKREKEKQNEIIKLQNSSQIKKKTK